MTATGRPDLLDEIRRDLSAKSISSHLLVRQVSPRFSPEPLGRADSIYGGATDNSYSHDGSTQMASVATYLNFMGRTEEAFKFYKAVFATEYLGELMRMGDVPASPDMPELSDADKQAVMHVALPILGGHHLMGTDALESMGHTLVEGNNVSIMLQPDTREEADELFAKLSAGGTDLMPMQDMFWGDYFGSLCDRFGIRWMIDIPSQPT